MSHSVLITGASGYIGSHFAKYFHQNGFTVIGLDQVPQPSVLTNFVSEFYQGDIGDSNRIRPLIQENSIEAVVHCAAYCLVGESVQEPDKYRNNNVERATLLARAAIDAGAKAFLLSSTAAVYGEPETIPIPENHPKNPINPYGETKWAFERRLAEMNQRNLICTGALRYFNAAGADPEGELGECHDPETHLIPNAIYASMGKKDVFEIFGTDYSTRDGTCERDYIHVWDLAAAHLLLLQQMLKTNQGGTFNLGTGQGYTVKEVLDEVDRQANTPVRRKASPRRPGDPAVLVADPSRAKSTLGWKPQHSDLPTIIRHALTWHLKR